MVSIRPSKELPIRSTTVEVDDLPKIFRRLLQFVEEEADLVIADLVKNSNQSNEDYELFKQHSRTNAFKITVTVEASDGTRLFGDDVSLFSAASMPENVSLIYMTNRNAFSYFSGNDPLNYFELWLDFTKPSIFDATDPVSHPTPNRSNLKIIGNRDSWIASIEHAVFDVLRYRGNSRGWLHRGHVYDIGLLVVGLPFAFYMCYRLFSYVEVYIEPIHTIVSGAMYAYLVLLSIWMYRFIFTYLRWIFPNVELLKVSSAPFKHRIILLTIMIAIIGDIIVEMIA